MRIQIIGASGAGKSFLGRKLSEELNCTWVDTDDILWVWSDDVQPYTVSVSDFDACFALKEKLDNNESIVASGLFYPWAEPLIGRFDLVISLTTDVNIRRKRIIDREIEMYGDRVSPFGDMYNQFQEFIKWSDNYDFHDDIYGSKKYTDIWLSKFSCPILKIDGNEDVDENLKKIKDFILKIKDKGVEKNDSTSKIKKR